VSTLIKKTDGEQSPPYRHCERSEAPVIASERSERSNLNRICQTTSKRLLRALPIAMTMTNEGEAVPAVRFAHRRPPHPSRNFPPTSLVAIHIKPLRGLAEFTFS